MTRFATLETDAERRKREREEALALLLIGFLWDSDNARYLTRAGRVVPLRTIRRAVDAVVEATRVDVEAISRLVANGDIDVAEWQDGVARRLKTMHVATASAASGGFQNMSPAAVARLEGTLRFHLTKLEGFAGDVSRGYTTLHSVQINSETGELQDVVRVVRMTESLIVSRAEMYALAGASDSYEGGRHVAAAEAGYQFERNILARSDHCEGCLEQTARGWVGYGQLVPVGRRTCLTRCACSLQFARELPVD